MKTLTVKQPWASLIVAGIKDIENRTWATKYRGPMLIHASGKYANYSFTVDQIDAICGDMRYNINNKLLPVSAIIGQVDIVDCVIDHPSIWAEQSWYANNMSEAPQEEHDTDFIVYNWVLANPVQFDEPILNVKGKLSLWEWERLK